GAHFESSPLHPIIDDDVDIVPIADIDPVVDIVPVADVAPPVPAAPAPFPPLARSLFVDLQLATATAAPRTQASTNRRGIRMVPPRRGKQTRSSRARTLSATCIQNNALRGPSASLEILRAQG